jgi:hypothetical protein
MIKKMAISKIIYLLMMICAKHSQANLQALLFLAAVK